METDNFDKLTTLWTSDASFREAVRRDPAAAVASRGIVLSDDETRALKNLQIENLGDAALEARISKIDDGC